MAMASWSDSARPASPKLCTVSPTCRAFPSIRRQVWKTECWGLVLSITNDSESISWRIA